MENLSMLIDNIVILITMYPYYFATGAALLIGGVAALIREKIKI